MYSNLMAAAIGLSMGLVSGGAFAQTSTSNKATWNDWRYQATNPSKSRTHRKVYYGVGFGEHHRTTATGGNAGGYSDRN